MKVLVTGANGFIGSRLVSRLQEADAFVVGAVRANHSPQCSGDFMGRRRPVRVAEMRGR